MRHLLALTLFISLAAHADESADFASTAVPPKSWNATRDMVSDDEPNHAKVRAFINGLLGEERPSQKSAEENSGPKLETEK